MDPLSNVVDMTTVGVLIVAIALLAFVFYWSGHYGDRKRSAGTSLRRNSHAHTTRQGRPKKSYATRADAEASARRLTRRAGDAMNAYKCDSCSKWHIGHDS